MVVNKGNIHSISHYGNTLTVEFMGNGARYQYQPFSSADFEALKAAALDEDKEVFKKHFKEKVKDNAKLEYKRL